MKWTPGNTPINTTAAIIRVMFMFGVVLGTALGVCLTLMLT